jgi:hypothetical protein
MQEMGSTEYRGYAAECVRAAAKVKDHEIKAALLAMVEVWLYLAELADKNAAEGDERRQHSARLN